MRPSSPRLRVDRATSVNTGAHGSEGRIYPIAFIVGFILVIAVNAVLIVLASSSFSGLETAGAYEKGLAYNATLGAARAQAALGWQAELEIKPQAGTAAEDRLFDFSVRLADSSGRPLSGERVQAFFVRPTRAGNDFSLDLAPQTSGWYGARLQPPLAGQWEVTIVASRAAGEGTGSTWQTARRIYLP